MPRESRLSIALPDVEAVLDRQGRRVFSKAELASLVQQERGFWRLAQRTTTEEFVGFLIKRSKLSVIEFTAREYSRRYIRYVWRDASDFELALSLGGPTSYLSHASAVFLHGLSELIPRVVYVNDEQSPKPQLLPEPTQSSIARAFARKQRATRMILEAEERTPVAVISGKSTGNLEVANHEFGYGSLRATSIERTLIDCVVRPAYAGGISNVFDAFRAAVLRKEFSVVRMYATLQHMKYAYPYHQSIGFLLERAGVQGPRLDVFRALPRRLDFYLTHAMETPDYDPSWKIYYPRGLL